jgi:pyruvate dehydrogenase E2 component (dihydrolipoyllysine-residue acetyltransferase)
VSAPIFPVTMPKWGIEMTEGTVTALSAREGQSLAKGDALLEVETDKIVNTLESPAAGTLRRILVEPGEVKPVGALIAVLAEPVVSDAELASFIANFKGASVSFEPDAGTSGALAPGDTSGGRAEQLVSPVAAQLAQTLGIDLSKVTGTGRKGRVMREDVEAYAASRAAAAENPVTRVRMSPARQVIARRLSESKQTIPHYRLAHDIDASALVSQRETLKRAGVRVTVNDLIVAATAAALIKHPAVNAQLAGEEILQYRHADIALAVATPQGLLTPILRSVDTLPLEEIARRSAELAARARAGTLTREEVAGGTFTVSNLGMYGLDSFDAIIYPPQVAILAIGALRERVLARAGLPVVAPSLTLTLSADHRVIDGAMAAQFVATLTETLERPAHS